MINKVHIIIVTCCTPPPSPPILARTPYNGTVTKYYILYLNNFYKILLKYQVKFIRGNPL